MALDSITSRSSLREAEPVDLVLHLSPDKLVRMFGIDEPLMTGIKLGGEYIEPLTDITLRFPVQKDGKPLAETRVLVDGLPHYIHAEVFEQAQTTVLRYMVAEALAAPNPDDL